MYPLHPLQIILSSEENLAGNQKPIFGCVHPNVQARNQDFLWGSAIQRGDGPNEAEGGGVGKGMGCLRLHYKRFEKLAIFQIVILQK